MHANFHSKSNCSPGLCDLEIISNINWTLLEHAVHVRHPFQHQTGAIVTIRTFQIQFLHKTFFELMTAQILYLRTNETKFAFIIIFSITLQYMCTINSFPRKPTRRRENENNNYTHHHHWCCAQNARFICVLTYARMKLLTPFWNQTSEYLYYTFVVRTMGKHLRYQINNWPS